MNLCRIESDGPTCYLPLSTLAAITPVQMHDGRGAAGEVLGACAAWFDGLPQPIVVGMPAATLYGLAAHARGVALDVPAGVTFTGGKHDAAPVYRLQSKAGGPALKIGGAR